METFFTQKLFLKKLVFKRNCFSETSSNLKKFLDNIAFVLSYKSISRDLKKRAEGSCLYYQYSIKNLRFLENISSLIKTRQFCAEIEAFSAEVTYKLQVMSLYRMSPRKLYPSY